ncbi:MAG: acyl-CoA carboxylase subunit beta [bacterium]
MSHATQDPWKTKEHLAFNPADAKHQEHQKKTGKSMARERLDKILDPKSFQETDLLALSPFLDQPFYTDGVITGFGTINNKKVAIYAQDFTLKGGSLGKRHAEKICKIMDLAAKIGCPIIGIIDSGGARIDEGIHALAGYGQIFSRNVRYSGVIPQISLILGPCAGGAAYSPALTDFVFMTKQISNMFITGPQVIKQALHQEITMEELGGCSVHGPKSGVAHIITQTEDEAFEKLKSLLYLLPSNYLDTSHNNNTEQAQEFCRPILDPGSKADLTNIVSNNMNKAYDMKHIISHICDAHTFFEIQEIFAPNIITGLAKLDNKTVGIVANQPIIKAGTIDIDASVKAARFIRFCDSFDIPIISLVDVPGFLPGIDQEHHGIIKHGAKLLYAYASATVPKITVILRKAFGGAYIVMGSKELGADFNFAWPSAQIAVLGASAAITILHGKKIALEPEETRAQTRYTLEKEYDQEFLNPFIAAQSGYIDAIIEPNMTRESLIKALNITDNKIEHIPKKKHGNIPL